MAAEIKITPPGTKGKFHSLEQAFDELKKRCDAGKLKDPVTILCAGGSYPLKKTLELRSNFPVPVTVKAQDGAEVVFDGGCKLTGWKEVKVNGKKALCASVPEEAVTDGFLRAMVVNGKYAIRASFPKDMTGGLRFKDILPLPSTDPEVQNMQTDKKNSQAASQNALVVNRDGFYIHEEDFDKSWYNQPGIEAVVIQQWADSFMPSPVLKKDGEVRFALSSSRFDFSWSWQSNRYFWKNVREALLEPGEFYFDNTENNVYYLPRKGEKAATLKAFVPVVSMLVLMQDCSNITLEGITFRHGGAKHPYLGINYDTPYNLKNYFIKDSWRRFEFGYKCSNAPQSAIHLPGVIFLNRAVDCALKDCKIEFSNWYGIAISGGCANIEVSGCELANLGGGGILVNGGDVISTVSTAVAAQVDDTGMPLGMMNLSRNQHQPEEGTHNISITDNKIHHCGNLYLSACGIIIGQAWGCLVEHNDIHDLYYTGISCGWNWGYGYATCRENRIGFNRIHDLGKKVLCDMGGIYLLGIQPGTRLYNNYAYNITCNQYGGWGYYTDEGSSHIVIENNICHDCSCEGFHQHFGRENQVRHNIAVFNAHHGVALSRGNSHPRGYVFPGQNFSHNYNFHQNVVVVDNKPFFTIAAKEIATPEQLFCDMNFYFDVSGKSEKNFALIDAWNANRKMISFKEWRETFGHDIYTKYVDPGFMDLEKRDFRLKKDSPLRKVNFPDPAETIKRAGVRKKKS